MGFGLPTFSNLVSYKDANQLKLSLLVVQPPIMLIPYIVEKLDKVPSLEIKHIEVNELFLYFKFDLVICRFNQFWTQSILLFVLGTYLFIQSKKKPRGVSSFRIHLNFKHCTEKLIPKTGAIDKKSV